jgi:Flp pilus assembly pilin Flp
MSFWKTFFNEESGQDMVEYGLVVGLIALVAIVAFQAFSTSLNGGITAQAKQVADHVK